MGVINISDKLESVEILVFEKSIKNLSFKIENNQILAIEANQIKNKFSKKEKIVSKNILKFKDFIGIKVKGFEIDVLSKDLSTFIKSLQNLQDTHDKFSKIILNIICDDGRKKLISESLRISPYDIYNIFKNEENIKFINLIKY